MEFSLPYKNMNGSLMDINKYPNLLSQNPFLNIPSIPSFNNLAQTIQQINQQYQQFAGIQGLANNTLLSPPIPYKQNVLVKPTMPPPPQQVSTNSNSYPVDFLNFNPNIQYPLTRTPHISNNLKNNTEALKIVLEALIQKQGQSAQLGHSPQITSPENIFGTNFPRMESSLPDSQWNCPPNIFNQPITREHLNNSNFGVESLILPTSTTSLTSTLFPVSQIPGNTSAAPTSSTISPQTNSFEMSHPPSLSRAFEDDIEWISSGEDEEIDKETNDPRTHKSTLETSSSKRLFTLPSEATHRVKIASTTGQDVDAAPKPNNLQKEVKFRTLPDPASCIGNHEYKNDDEVSDDDHEIFDRPITMPLLHNAISNSPPMEALIDVVSVDSPIKGNISPIRNSLQENGEDSKVWSQKADQVLEDNMSKYELVKKSETEEGTSTARARRRERMPRKKQKSSKQSKVSSHAKEEKMLRVPSIKIFLNHGLPELTKSHPEGQKLRKRKHNQNGSDPEYKSRSRIEDDWGDDEEFHDPVAIGKSRRQTSAERKKEKQANIDKLYNEIDDSAKLDKQLDAVIALKKYERGEYITKFCGNLVNRKFYNTHKEDRLMIEIGNGRWIDGTDDPSYGVHIPPSVKPNAEIKLLWTSDKIPFVAFYATKLIPEGTPLSFST